VLVVLVAAVCIRLGFWQLERLEQRRELNAAVAAAQARPSLELDAASLDSLRSTPSSFEHRPAVARGAFVPHGEMLVRGRALHGRPGVHLYAPLRLAGSGVLLLVNRGWLPAPDGATADPRPYRSTEPVTVRGTLQQLAPSGADLVAGPIDLPDTTVASYLRLDRSVAPGGIAALPLYLQLAPPLEGSSGPSLPTPLPVAPLDDGPHLGYAIQWFGFAAVALIGFGVVASRRRSRAPE
jgi:surfeit locus 1 family protein